MLVVGTFLLAPDTNGFTWKQIEDKENGNLIYEITLIEEKLK